MLTDKNNIRGMWAEHFENLGTPSTNINSDSTFLDRVSASVQEFVTSCKNDPVEDLNEPLTYGEVANVCSKLKSEVSGVLIDYQYVRFAGPALWNFLFELYNDVSTKLQLMNLSKSGQSFPCLKVREQKQTTKIIIEV